MWAKRLSLGVGVHEAFCWLLLYRGLSGGNTGLGLEPNQQSHSQAVLGVIFKDGSATNEENLHLQKPGIFAVLSKYSLT